MMFALAVAMLAVSCQKNDLNGSSNTEVQVDAAYVSLSIKTPLTRAGIDGTKEDGVGDENKIFSLALLAFDKNYDYIGSYQSYASEGKFNCEIAPDARRFFAVVNPTKEIWADINKVSSLSQSEFASLPAIALTASSVSTANMKTDKSATRGFTMVNCGAKNPDGILLEALVSVDVELSQDKKSPTPVTITVDRLVSKFEYTKNANFEANTKSKFGEESDFAVGELLGVALTATNKASFLYSKIAKDNLTLNNVYRTDHNMAIGQGLSDVNDIIDALKENFNWLNNENEDTDAAFIAPGVSKAEYALENTCDPGYSNSNNLTQAIVKAKYNPTMSNSEILPLGTSWFKMYTSDGTGTLYLTFDEVVELYKGTYAGFIATDATKASMDVQLNNIMNSTDKKWSDDDVTLAALDAIPYGGYKAATVDSESDYILQYFQNAVNYYDIFIQHDDAQSVGHMGRWGMVRNNAYTMDVTGIMREGLPYIPDPTDSKIVDPENQSPEDPEPADKLNAYIDVNISVNPWVLWEQSSPLE